MAAVALLLLVCFSITGLLTVIFVRLSGKDEDNERPEMDNSEYDYGHDVHYDEQ